MRDRLRSFTAPLFVLAPELKPGGGLRLETVTGVAEYSERNLREVLSVLDRMGQLVGNERRSGRNSVVPPPRFLFFFAMILFNKASLPLLLIPSYFSMG